MRIQNFNTLFLIALLLAVGLLAVLVLQPFLTATLVAAMLATLFQKPYRFLLRIFRNARSWSATCAVLLVAVSVILPMMLVVTIAFGETARVLGSFSASGGSLPSALGIAEDWLFHIPYIGPALHDQGFAIEDVFANNFSSTSGFIINFFQAVYGSVAGFTLWIFSMFFALFYFFVDGPRIVSFLKRMSPLRDEEDDELIHDFVSISRAMIKGSLVVALIQGFLGGLSFFVVGLPSPVVWGVVMAFLSLIPVLGAGLVWFPASMWFLFSGEVWQGVFLLAFGFGIVSTIDNVLRPKLIGRDTEIHPLLVFFSTLGGLSLFGLAGFLIGPIIVSFFVALVRIYGREFKGQLDSYNRG